MGLDMYLRTESEREVAYWRKSNAIHGWFVDNLMNGIDEYQKVYVSKENIFELLNIATTTLIEYERGNMEKVKELLPPKAGFFFGSYDIDENYREDLINTIQKLAQLIDSEDKLYYQASW